MKLKMNGNPNQWVANPNKDQIRALGQSPVFFFFFFFFFLFLCQMKEQNQIELAK